jgi:IS30 family transposase
MSCRVDDRITIQAQLKLEFKAAAIASALNRAPSTISRDEFSGAHAILSD